MSTKPQLRGSGDCTLLKMVWGWLWDSTNQFYLPNAIQKGLKIPALGIDIPPFDTVNIGDLDEITMFKEPVLGYMKIKLTNNSVKNLHQVKGSNYSCDDSSSQTTLSFQLDFTGLELDGKYTVSAGGGIGGCAIAAASKVLGGGGSDMLADGVGGLSPVDQHNNLALWYRNPLAESDNGQVLLGAHEEHNDTIYDLQQNSPLKELYWGSLRENNVQATTEAVTTATQYYHDHQTGQLTEEQLDADPPTIGTNDQYGSGQAPYAYMLAMARAAKKSPDDRYAKLEQVMTHFLGSIDWVQKNHPGEHPIGGEGGVLDIIAKAPPEAVHDHVMSLGSYDIADPRTDEVIVTVEPPAEPLDYDYYRQVYKQHAARYGTSDAVDSTAAGDYSDTNINVTGKITGTLTSEGGKLTCTITKLDVTISSIDVKLSKGQGWWPGLFDKVTTWVANAGFLKDIIKSKMSDQLSSDDMKKRLGDLITGALQKI